MSRIEQKVAAKMLDRAKFGAKKYGTTMERNDLTLSEWLTHLQEEMMDAAVYIEKIQQELRYQEIELADRRVDDLDGKQYAEYMLAKSEDRKSEERMKNIGQNGNDGLHYNTTLYPGDIHVTYETIKKEE